MTENKNFQSKPKKISRKAQTAIEYLLLLAVSAVIVFVGFKTILPRTSSVSNVYFNKVARGIMGEPFTYCGDGNCNGSENCNTCPVDCGPCCPNGTCDFGETCDTCPLDCKNGVCEAGETCGLCPDCGEPDGQPCSQPSECCPGHYCCNNTCSSTACCIADGQTCDPIIPCCGGNCCSNTCSSTACCKPDGQSCSSASECCGGNCCSGSCSSTACSTGCPPGECVDQSDCGSACCATWWYPTLNDCPYYCVSSSCPAGQCNLCSPCSGSYEGQNCDIASLQVCGQCVCRPAGSIIFLPSLCSTACCSGSCLEDCPGGGLPCTYTCTAASCKSIGDACTNPGDCCSGHCYNGACTYCLGDGESCSNPGSYDPSCCGLYCDISSQCDTCIVQGGTCSQVPGSPPCCSDKGSSYCSIAGTCIGNGCSTTGHFCDATYGCCLGCTCEGATQSCVGSCGSSCFVAGILIATERGFVPIEKLQKGMKVWSHSTSGKLELAPVTKTIKHKVSNHLRIELENGRTIEVTKEHPFFDPILGDYRKAGTFKAGDTFLEQIIVKDMKTNDALPSKSVKIRSITNIEGKVEVYNLTVGGNHNYFAEGILVHNK